MSDYLYSKDYDFYLDDMSNIYITKGETEFYPCFVAHLDTVHHMSNILVKEEKHPNDHGEYKDALKAYTPFSNQPTGIGGDDKCGIFVCLQLLEKLDNVKVAFFVSEEIGCIGSSVADDFFFDR